MGDYGRQWKEQQIDDLPLQAAGEDHTAVKGITALMIDQTKGKQ